MQRLCVDGKLLGLACAMLILGLMYPTTSMAADEFVAIVHVENETKELSMLDLRRIYRGEKRRWTGGAPIRVLLPNRGSQAMQFVVTQIFEMKSVVEVAQYYMEAIYREQVVETPPTMTAERSIRLVAESKRAIALVPRTDVIGIDGIKILEIDGEGR